MTAEDWPVDEALEGEEEEYKQKKMQKNKKNKQNNQPLNCSANFLVTSFGSANSLVVMSQGNYKNCKIDVFKLYG